MTIDINGNPVIGVELNGNPISNVAVDGQNVWEEAFFDVQNISAPNEVNEGNSFTVSADIVNTSNGAGEQSIDFNRGGSTTVSLGANQSTNVSFSETINNAGSYTLTISSDDDSVSRTIDVINPDAFDLTKLTFDTSISTIEDLPTDIAWSNDGTRMYQVGARNDRIHQFTASTPFEIRTVSPDTSISTQDATPTGITWNNDGTRLYEAGANTPDNNLVQYTVSTPFDISTASVSKSIDSQDQDPTGIAWNDDGSRLYEVGEDSDTIYQYNVSTPFDIGTASLDTSISTQTGFSRDIEWNNDGTRLYELGPGFISGRVYQYTLTTPFDIDTASFDFNERLSNDDLQRGMAWNNTGTRLHIIGQIEEKIEQYILQ